MDDSYIDVAEKYASKEAVDYQCPNCMASVTDLEDEYCVDGVAYPIYVNDYTTPSMDGSFESWEEVHVCTCGQKYHFSNGT